MGARHPVAAFTARAVWSAISFPRFEVDQIRMRDGVSRTEAVRIMEQLAAEGWVEPVEGEGSLWQAGPMVHRMAERGPRSDLEVDAAMAGPLEQ